MVRLRWYRGYHDVFDYLADHPEKVEVKSRSALLREDGGLYKSLSRCLLPQDWSGNEDNGNKFSLLDFFFPNSDEGLVERGRRLGKGERKLSGKEREDVLSKYEPSRGNPYAARKLFGHSAETYLKYWKAAGLKIKRIR